MGCQIDEGHLNEWHLNEWQPTNTVRLVHVFMQGVVHSLHVGSVPPYFLYELGCGHGAGGKTDCSHQHV